MLDWRPLESNVPINWVCVKNHYGGDVEKYLTDVRLTCSAERFTGLGGRETWLRLEERLRVEKV